MTEAQLSKQNFEKTIVTLNANIVGYFQAMNHDNSRSVHVGHITSIEITSNKQGKHALWIKTYGGKATFLNAEVDDMQLDKVKEFVAEVQRAMQSATLSL